MATKSVSTAPVARRLSGPHTAGALTIFFLHAADSADTASLALLPSALAEREVVVRETRTVSQLALDNHSGRTVFGLVGDLVKGGHQDRTLVADILVAPGAHDQPLPTYCVEQGRWCERRGESSRTFRESHTMAPATMRSRLTLGTHQGEVWSEVSRTQQRLGTLHGGEALRDTRSATSLQLTLEDDTLQRELARYHHALRELPAAHDDVVGHAVALDGALRHAEWFASRELHARLWPRLLDALCTEAVAAAPEAIGRPAPALSELERWLARVLAYGPQPLERSGSARLRRRAGARGTARETLWAELETPLHTVVACA